MDLDNNLTMNFTSYEYAYDMPDVSDNYNMPHIVTYSVLLYLGLCTNIWMLWSLYKTWETGSRAHFFLLAICVADIIALCVRCSIGIGVVATIVWQGGAYGCKIFMSLNLFGNYLAHFVLAGFNVDNVITIIINRSLKALRIFILVIAIVLTVLICVPQVFLYELHTIGVKYIHAYCILSGGYMIPLILYIGLLWLPLFFILFCGGPALCVWCGKKGSIAYQKMNQEDGSNNDMKHIGRDIGIVVAYNIVFILCWMPAGIFDIYHMFGGYMFLDWVVFKVLDYITVANSVFNPLIYAIFQCINRRTGNVSPGL